MGTNLDTLDSWGPGGSATQTPEQVLEWVNNFLKNWLNKAKSTTRSPSSAGGGQVGGSGSSQNNNNNNRPTGSTKRPNNNSNSNDVSRGGIPRVPGSGTQNSINN